MRLWDCPPHPQLQMSTASPGCQPCFWPTSYRWELPTTPSEGSINLVEQLTGLRGTLYLLDHWLIIKGYNWGRARWKRRTGRGMRKGPGASTPSPGATLPAPLRVHQPRSPLNPVLLGFMEASSHRHDWWNHWPLAIDSTCSPSPLPRGGWGEKVKIPTL